MFAFAFLQAAQPSDSTSSCLTVVITWAPFLLLVGIWLFSLRRMGYFNKRSGYLKRSEEHMDRVEETLTRIEEHLRILAERDRRE